MAMATAYLNLIAAAGAAEISHIGLVDEVGAEISGGTYARQEVTWASPDDGTNRPTGNLTFDVPEGETVAGWRAFDALTSGTNYGGEDLTPQEFTSDGTYTLLSAQTAIHHAIPA